ncbi:hypothetical protein PLEOSDRAFT_1048928 [Pleurotus ostreatus PC15]|uniref:Thioesterase domain-containing protein n=1 Tax=Pleurotus ostreatus (strain PC15) TaxID=1137138 RepID=A0A067N5J3_PLEO1|nr:hypothetical protein PLEOSDRAFT_1048928 [Pleurotus ostreatus PC15]
MSLKATPATIIRVLPTLAKYILYLLVLLNIRSFPLAWHVRVFQPVTNLRIKYRLFRLTLLFKSKKLKDKADAEWWDSVSPIGRNPFQDTVTYTSWSSIDDSDFNLHLSNSSYAKALDAGRFQAALQWFPQFFRLGGWCPLAATHYHFIREIPMLAPYEVRVRIGAWDDKWMYVICRFVTKPKSKSKKHAVMPPAAPATTGDGFISAHALHTPAYDSDLNTSVSPTPIPSSTVHPPPSASTLDKLLHSQQHTEEPDGAVLHTVSISQICFKHGRITVPPALVLAINGFSASPRRSASPSSMETSSVVNISLPNTGSPQTTAYSCANPPPHWDTVRQMMYVSRGGHPKKMQALMKGGWKEVEQEKRWWVSCLGGEIEELRIERLALLDGIRKGTESARGIL